ncbi:MAG TPA: sigma-70 family RNA polymerase sigma factor [Solirubrobacterales bacterium]|nr:sigma-70 family RNA polymerase sigma factor [Solirubrobacterales bacterium]
MTAQDREPLDAATRRRVAVETFARHEASLRRTAGRYSICADDADEALQRGLEILLRKAPSADPRELIRWTQTVVKHEALAVRAERERILAGPAAATPEPGREDWVAMLPAATDGPAERAERHEAIERSREALATLKPQELRALTLLAEGYSYREIGEITGFSATKVNRCVAEGRERFRHFLDRRLAGARCVELAPLLSAFADGEAEAGVIATLHEHLRSCPHCRATLRAYRAAPRAAAALAPVLPPLRGGLVDRLHDAYAAVATRFGGGAATSDSALGGFAAAGGTRGAGMAALAKVLAICAGTVGGAAACVATGVVPAPLLDPPEHHSQAAAKVSRAPQRLAETTETAAAATEYEPEAEPATATEGEPTTAAEERAPRRHHEPKGEEGESTEASAGEGVDVAATPPPSESGAVEYTEPPPAPSATSSSSSSASASPSSSSNGSAAGEFGP